MSYPSDLHDDDVLAGKDHELTLSTAAIFGIFFGLVALCAVFFGFGYSLGSHKSPALLPTESSTGSSANFSGFKPAAGQPAGAASTTHPATVQAAPVVAQPSAHDDASTTDEPAATPAPTPAPVVRVQPAVAPRPAAAQPVAAPAPAPAAAATPGGGLYVQVAAISVTHPGDATLMVNALRAKGYAASTHPAADNFIHVLIGPIPTRPDAEAMLKRLSADGYTAYIK